MSRTETLLLVVLGFSLATLIALFVSRMLWSAALRLGARRMQKQVPSTLVDLQTERDRLRAEYAMLSQRMGNRLEAARLKMAEQMAEVSRHRNRLELLEAERSAHDGALQGLKAEVMALTAQLDGARAEMAELRQENHEKQQRLDKALHELEAERRRTVSPTPGNMLLADSDPEHRLRERIERLNRMAKASANDHSPNISPISNSDLQPQDDARELPGEFTSDPLLAQKLAEVERETVDLQRELERLDAEWSKRLDEFKVTEDTIAPQEERTAAVANVISLANRIRDLKKGLTAS